MDDHLIQKNSVRITWFDPGVSSFDYNRRKPRPNVRLFVFQAEDGQERLASDPRGKPQAISGAMR